MGVIPFIRSYDSFCFYCIFNVMEEKFEIPIQNQPPLTHSADLKWKKAAVAVLVLVMAVGAVVYSNRVVLKEKVSPKGYEQVYSLVADKISQSAAIVVSLPRPISVAQAKTKIVFDPQLEGEWAQGEEEGTLVFQPAAKLDVGKYYSVTFTDVQVVLKKDFLVDEDPKIVAIFPKADSETSEKSEITIIFNRPMVPLTTLDVLEDQNIPVAITPLTQGRFKWVTTRNLQFIPKKRLQRSTRYAVEVKPGFVSIDGLPVAPTTHRFTTRPLRYEYMSAGEILYRNPIRVVFNQPFDIKRTKNEITVIAQAYQEKRDVKFIVTYGTRTVIDQKTKEEKVVTDKTILEIYQAQDRNGREKLWDFDTTYRFTIQRAYPLEGDIILEESKVEDISVSEVIRSLSAESPRSKYVEPDFFDPQGTLWVTFYEEIDKDKSLITNEHIREIGYGEKCKELEGKEGIYYRNKKDCEKEADKRKISIRFKEGVFGTSQIIPINFVRVVNNEGLQLNAETILKRITTYPQLTIARTIPADKATAADVLDFILCTTTPLDPADEDNFEDRLFIDPPIGKWNWFDPIKVTPNNRRYRSCEVNQFENKIRYGLIPETSYRMELNVFDDFGQSAPKYLEFTSGKIPQLLRRFHHFHKRYNVTSPEKTKLTYAVENLEYVDMQICKIEVSAMLRFLQEPPQWNQSGGFECRETIKDRIELPRRFWVKNYFEVDIKDYFQDLLGHYVITFSHPDYRNYNGVQRYEHTRLSVTRLAVQEKKVDWRPNSYRPDPHEDIMQDAFSRSEQNLYWVAEFGTLDPVVGATVDLYQKEFPRSSSFAKTSSATTNFQGIAQVNVVPNLIGAIITKGKDSTIVSTLTDRLQWASAARSDERTYIYTDRPIYRPGDKVSIKGLYRVGYDGEYEIFRDEKAQIEVFNSRGDSALKQDMQISEYGTFVVSFMLDTEASLGTYRIEALGGRGSFDVEEYVPSPFKVEVRADQDEYIAGDIMKLVVDADYFFGVPLEGGDVEYSVVSQDYFFDRFQDQYFQFGRGWYYSYNQGYGDTYILRGRTILDNSGEARIEHQLDFEKLFKEGKRDRSKIFVLNVTVKNQNGQSVSAQKSFIVHRGEFYLGLHLENTFFGKGDSLITRVKSVDTNGEPVSIQRNMTLEINKVTWEYFKRQEVDGGYYYKSEKKTEPVKVIAIQTDATGNYSQEFRIDEEGQYEITVRAQDVRGNPVSSTRDFYVYGPGVVSIRPTNNETLDLATEKAEVDVGEQVKIIIKSPYTRAKALVSIERGKIFHYEIIDIDRNLVDYSFDVKESYIPNVYVSILLLSPKPEIKYGQINYKVNTKQKEIQVDIKTDKNHYLPGEEVRVEVETRDWKGALVSAELSLAVADVSVLALKGNPKKNPIVFFYGGMPLAVTTASNIKNILYEVEIPLGTKGGGAPARAEDLARKKRGIFEDTAFWQGVVRTDASGRASISFTLPDNLTTWQVESVGITKDTKLGSGYYEFITRKEVMVVPLRPRFIVPGDEFLLGAKVFNQTDAAQILHVSFSSDTLEIIDGKEIEAVTLEKDENKTVYFSVRAPKNVDEGKHVFILSAQNVDYEDTVENTIRILPNNTYETVATAHFTGDPKSREYIYLPKNIVKDRGGVNIHTSATLAVFLSDALNYLVSYPYGCSEQIASKLSSIAIVKRGLNLENVGDKFTLKKVEFEGQEYSVDDVVKIGLARIYENQTPSGGFVYYKSMYSRPNFHLTLHIVNTLKDIENGGYEINKSVLDRGARYLYSQITIDPDLNSNKDLVIITAYTLSRIESFSGENAVLKQRVLSIIKETKFIREDISNSSLTHLAILLVKEGYPDATKKEVFKVLENRVEIDARGAFLGLHKTNWLPQYYETPIKDTAFLLKALVADKKETPIIDKIVRWLLRSRAKDGAWSSTNNSVAVIDAFTDFLEWRKETKSEFDLTLTVDNSKIAAYEFNGDTILETFEHFIPVSDFTLGDISVIEFSKKNRNEEFNTFYYDMSFRYFLPIDTIAPRDEGFTLTREFYALDDEDFEHPLSEARVGDVLRGRLTITVPQASNFLAVEDFIPAGVEIVNLRLATEDQSLREKRQQDTRFYPGFGQSEILREQKFQMEGIVSFVSEIFEKQAPHLLAFLSFMRTDTATVETEEVDYDDYIEIPSYVSLRPDAEEFHDDRLFLFKERVSPGVYEFGYFVRALIPGTYHHLPAMVSEMYFPENFGRTSGRYFNITP